LLLKLRLVRHSLADRYYSQWKLLAHDDRNEGCKTDEYAIRWFASMTLYTLCLAVRLTHDVRLGIHG
jgi:hypothetical protein